MSAELPEVRVGQVWRASNGLDYEVQSVGKLFELHNLKCGSRWSEPDTLEGIVEKIRRNEFRLVSDGPYAAAARAEAKAPISQEEADEIVSKRITALESENRFLRVALAGRAGAIVTAVKVLEANLRARISRAGTQPEKKRALNALAALEGIAEFLGGAEKAEGGVK